MRRSPGFAPPNRGPTPPAGRERPVAGATSPPTEPPPDARAATVAGRPSRSLAPAAPGGPANLRRVREAAWSAYRSRVAETTALCLGSRTAKRRIDRRARDPPRTLRRCRRPWFFAGASRRTVASASGVIVIVVAAARAGATESRTASETRTATARATGAARRAAHGLDSAGAAPRRRAANTVSPLTIDVARQNGSSPAVAATVGNRPRRSGPPPDRHPVDLDVRDRRVRRRRRRHLGL